MSFTVEALPSVDVEGFSLTSLLCAAAAARHIGCSPDPARGYGPRDPEEMTRDPRDDVDDRVAQVVPAVVRVLTPNR
jgi:hypothetical protein